ncbi:MAG: hypothetical protein SVJ22_09255 [Halobacteriota archaeon]|nr:hypothetical protein [Halobacteriota archaeon]
MSVLETIYISTTSLKMPFSIHQQVVTSTTSKTIALKISMQRVKLVGTTDNDTINASIYDKHDNAYFGEVIYKPKLTSASPGAPVPESTTVISLAVGLIVILGYVNRYRRNFSGIVFLLNPPSSWLFS